MGQSSPYIYIRLGNAYMLASTAIQPLYGQVSSIIGWRHPRLASVALFALESGIAGAATSPSMFIAGRLVQGLGGGGTVMLIDLIVCDLVQQRYYCREPTMPPRLFTVHRTAASVYLQDFIVSLLLTCCLYALPLYF